MGDDADRHAAAAAFVNSPIPLAGNEDKVGEGEEWEPGCGQGVGFPSGIRDDEFAGFVDEAAFVILGDDVKDHDIVGDVRVEKRLKRGLVGQVGRGGKQGLVVAGFSCLERMPRDWDAECGQRGEVGMGGVGVAAFFVKGVIFNALGHDVFEGCGDAHQSCGSLDIYLG